MDIRAAIRREERKLEKQMAHLQRQLNGVKAAARALGHSAAERLNGAGRTGKRMLSEGARAKISKAAKKRWAKYRAQAKKAIT